MAKMTILKMVQNILSDMDSDEIAAIGDTVESEQVATVIENVYYNLIENQVIPENNCLLQVESLGDPARPNYLRLPTDVNRLEWIKYDAIEFGETRKRYKDIDYLSPEEFLRRSLSRNSDDADITTVLDFSGSVLLIKNDQAPSYWTSFDDEYMVFDAYDREVDTTLQESKTLAWGRKRPFFNAFDNDFIPDLDGNYFQVLYNDARMLCFDLFKQTQPAIGAAMAREQRIKIQNDKHRFAVEYATPDYGRKRNK